MCKNQNLIIIRYESKKSIETLEKQLIGISTIFEIQGGNKRISKMDRWDKLNGGF